MNCKRHAHGTQKRNFVPLTVQLHHQGWDYGAPEKTHGKIASEQSIRPRASGPAVCVVFCFGEQKVPLSQPKECQFWGAALPYLIVF